MRRRGAAVLPAALAAAVSGAGALALPHQSAPAAEAQAARRALPHLDPEITWFFDAALPDERRAGEALRWIAELWKDGYAAMIVDMARFMRRAGRNPDVPDEMRPRYGQYEEPDMSRPSRGATDLPVGPRDPSALARARLIAFLEKRTGQHFGDDLNRWREWIWKQPYDPHPDYGAFKGMVYEHIDPRMRIFFPRDVRSTVRLDEIDWGGVRVNGIPPLDQPARVPAAEARYLKDSHIVFGIEVNGESRAYPKRILAWHELARDTIGGVDLTIVYCTLCGTVIPYESVVGGRKRTFGTSGLLYRSNKLMFDAETMSLWSSLDGRPVVGALAGLDLQLKVRPVVTTTWREWKTAHPQTTVLSLDTGFKRDYSEGAAYASYFSDDRLMFGVSQTDTRLKNKAEVLVLRPPPGDHRSPLAAPAPPARDDRPVAIWTEFLRRNPVYHLSAGRRALVVITSSQGANRVYDAGTVRFTRAAGDGAVEDAAGGIWRVTEEALVADGGSARRLPRVPAHRAFWFGWYAQFPDTELIK